MLDFVTLRLEARVGIEPTHKGFADLSLTTWVPRLRMSNSTLRSFVRCGHSGSFDCAPDSAPLRISPAGSRFAHARKPAQLGYRASECQTSPEIGRPPKSGAPGYPGSLPLCAITPASRIKLSSLSLDSINPRSGEGDE